MLSSCKNDKKAEIQVIIPYANEMLIIYTVKDKRTTNLYARKVNDVLKDLSGDILLDSTEKAFGAYSPKYEVKYAQKRNFISIIRYDYSFHISEKNGIDTYHQYCHTYFYNCHF